MNNILDFEINPAEIQERENFIVDTLEKATWAFRQLKKLTEEVEQNKAIAEGEINRIQSWLESVNKANLESISYFEGLLKNYYREAGKKVNTPYGTVTARKSKTWNYKDEEVLKFLNSNGYRNLIRVKEEINKSELKKIFKDGVNQETGEVLEGVDIVDTESITVKVM